MTDPSQPLDPADFLTQTRAGKADYGTNKPGGNGESVGAIPPMPDRIGRYRVRSILGKGGFGLVYLGEDEQLGRKVAIKVPHGHLVSDSRGAEAYLVEAKTVAALEHPHIVPVYDVGSTDTFPCFVVSKYIDGTDLSHRLGKGRMTVGETVGLLATVADALHFAHKRGFVHRDIKPGNILLDLEGRPYVGDFGLALREQDIGKGPRYAGTPYYMSPEQARGEGHRVDGRSDVFSLGVTLYQMLTGRLPFQGDTQEELLEVISRVEPKPLRQWDDRIDRELERICSKALSKRLSDRFDTAADLAEALRAYLQSPSSGAKVSVGVGAGPVPGSGSTPVVMTPAVAPPTPPPTGAMTPGGLTPADSGPLRIVPKGLRSFDEDDADFFLELLPGARDREGLPDSLRFWKKKIEESDPEKTFSVGLIYGPSGCGKSSLVRAGLLPRLAQRVVSFYVESTGEDTETRLVRLLRKRFPELPDHLGLKGLLGAIRQGLGPPLGQKVLIVFDQFEQWLFARKREIGTPLIDALRQCNGSRVQVIVMVRDDFWLAVSRFLRELEVKLVEGQNSALVDLFPLNHARKVLTAFGRANGDLPEGIGELSPEQKQFIEEAVNGLAQEEKVISVRLALFSQMMKGRPWTVETLRKVGGAEGLGVVFLEETFSAQTAPAEHRIHQKGVRAVLKALMPPAGTDIKGHMRSFQELLSTSGYERAPKEFEELVELLDRRLRLITPTDPEGNLQEDETTGATGLASPRGGVPSDSNNRFYQLTHDYLVPSIRDWLRRKQKETARGRAEILLEERAGLWQEKKLTRFLPTLSETINISWHTRPKDRTKPQNDMVGRAWRLHGLRVGGVALILIVAGFLGYEAYGRFEGRRHRDRLLEASWADVPGVLGDVKSFGYWTAPLLRAYLTQAEADPAGTEPGKLVRARLGLLGLDRSQVGPLVDRMLDADPGELVLIRDQLRNEGGDLKEPLESLWSLLSDSKVPGGKVLRAACVLSGISPEDGRWKGQAGRLAEILVQQEPFRLLDWTKALAGISQSLLEPLKGFLFDENRTVSDRGQIAKVYGELTRNTSTGFADLEQGLALSGPSLKEIIELSIKINKSEGTKESQALKEQFIKLQKAHLEASRHRASAAIGLLAMDQWERPWSILRYPLEKGDPTARSYVISRLGASGVSPDVVWDRFQKESDPSVRRALLLCLGGYKRDRLSLSQRQMLISPLLEIYKSDPDPGIHGVVRWLLDQWEVSRDRLASVEKSWLVGRADGNRKWFINSEGQTFVILEPKGVQEMGYIDRVFPGLIERQFAISTHEVTQEEFSRFRKPENSQNGNGGQDPLVPVTEVSWFDAAAYCNWLSEREGLPMDQWCYEPNVKGQYAEGMKLAKDHLKRVGYRLPTELEWEYACRAGSRDFFGFGGAEDLLEEYGWFDRNSFGRAHRVGVLRPNDFGLFDTHGNTWEWCQNNYDQFYLDLSQRKEGQSISDNNISIDINPQEVRLLRGGAFNVQGLNCRSAVRNSNYRPDKRLDDLGFRPSRTYDLNILKLYYK